MRFGFMIGTGLSSSLFWGVLLSGFLSGCALDSRSTPTADGSANPPESATRPLTSTETRVQFQFDRIRTVEYDGFTLPLLSSDGCLAAIQRSSAVDWETLVAGVDSGVPNAGRIAIVPICPVSGSSGEVSGSSGAGILDVEGADLLLGRSSDQQGFLVESPRLDGSRWIGKVGWSGGAPTWLVDDADVNAFAVIGPNEELAWCHRQRDKDRFALRIRRGESTISIPPPDGGYWIAPSFSSDGRFLYALRLRDGALAACAFAISETIGPTPIISIDLSWRANARMAYQTLVPIRTGGSVSDPRLYFYHPRFSRMAIWNPTNNRIALASPMSAAAISITDSTLVTASPEQLSLEPSPVEGSATDAKHSTSIVESLWIPIGLGSGKQVVVVHPKNGHLEIARVNLGAFSSDR